MKLSSLLSKKRSDIAFGCILKDWLNYQFDGMDATVSDVTLGRKWLLQMGKGARKNGLTIQYCMSPPRHMLQSLEIPVVSQVFCIMCLVEWDADGTGSTFVETVGLTQPFTCQMGVVK